MLVVWHFPPISRCCVLQDTGSPQLLLSAHVCCQACQACALSLSLSLSLFIA